MHRITDKLFIGDWGNANDYHFLTGNEIQSALNVCEHVTTTETLHERHHVPFPDAPEAPDEQILRACYRLSRLLDRGDRVLVHCLAGISRSPLVASVVIAVRSGNTFKASLDFVAKGRPAASPNRSFLRRGPALVAAMHGLLSQAQASVDDVGFCGCGDFRPLKAGACIDCRRAE